MHIIQKLLDRFSIIFFYFVGNIIRFYLNKKLCDHIIGYLVVILTGTKKKIEKLHNFRNIRPPSLIYEMIFFLLIRGVNTNR